MDTTVFACIMFLICFVLTVGVLVYTLNGFSYQLRRNPSKECLGSEDLEKGGRSICLKQNPSATPDSLSSRTSTIANDEYRTTVNSPFPKDNVPGTREPRSHQAKGKGRLVNSLITIHVEDMSPGTN